MSLFLGKIHYWLYNKIQWFEHLEEEIIKVAEAEGMDAQALRKEINNKYGEPLPRKALEDMIDMSNIHGWLQSKIQSSEGRMAAWTKKILESNENAINSIERVYINQGMAAGNEVSSNGVEIKNAQDMFNCVNDYILDGMPCDRVNEIITSEENIVTWKRRICVHKDIWDKENADVKVFYYMRNLWIKAFVNKADSNYEFIELEDGVNVIRNI